jgi:hypothetical protein
VNHDGPAQITIAGMTESGHRVWARSHDADLLAAALDDEELCDRPMKIAGGIAELG